MSKSISLKDQVYQHLTSLIVSGELGPNQRIDEDRICAELGISRTPVREALLLLENEGVLSKAPRKGFFLKAFSRKQVSELYVLIGALEGIAAALACDALSAETLNEMEFYTMSMDLAINTENYKMYYRQQLLFHNLFVESCGNELLIEEIGKLKRKLLKYDYSIDDIKEKQSYLLGVNRQHKEMLELFKNRDKAGLRTFLETRHWASDLAVFES